MSFFAAKRGPRGARLHTAALYNPSGVSTGPLAVLGQLPSGVQTVEFGVRPRRRPQLRGFFYPLGEILGRAFPLLRL